MIPDKIKTFFETLNYTISVCKVTYDKCEDESTIVFRNALYLRDGISVTHVSKCGDKRLKTFDVTENTFKLVGDVRKGELKLDKIRFLYGTAMKTNQMFDYDFDSPCVYLETVIREDVPNNIDSLFSTIPTLVLRIFDSKGFTQRTFAESLVVLFRNSKLFGYPENISIVEYLTYGEYSNQKGSMQSVFNKELSGSELSMRLPIIKSDCFC